MAEDVRQIERRFGDALTPLLAKIRQEIPSTEVNEYLDEVETYIIEHLDDFKEQERQPPPCRFSCSCRHARNFSTTKSMPWSITRPPKELVLVESSTYLNLFGSIERG